MKTLLLAALLLAPGVRAQTAAMDAPPPGFGLTAAGSDWAYREVDAAGVPHNRLLDADEKRRLADFFASHSGDAALSSPLYAACVLTGRDPETAGWFEGAGADLRLTERGRNAVPAAVLLAYAGSAPVPSVPAALPSSDAAVARAAALGARLPASFSSSDFDGAAARAALPDAPLPAPAAVRPPNPHARRDAIEDAAFQTTWWGYHAAWAADFTTTAMILKRGGYETDPLYTRFGNKNMVGVIGSAAVVHAGVSVASLWLHDEAKKHEGFKHYALETAAILVNGYGIGVHSRAAAGNAGVLDRWGRP